MTLTELLERHGVVVFDGAMGTMLYERGVPRGHCYDELNLSDPSIVRSVLEDYAGAGAHVLTTNTFGANRIILDRYYDLGDRTPDINCEGAIIARSAAGGRAVAGSVGPLSRPAEVFGEIPVEQMESVYHEQIEALVGGGVDFIVFETFSRIEELQAAARVVSRFEGLSAAACMTFPEAGATLTGMDAQVAGGLMDQLGTEIVGANCGTGPRDVLRVINRIGQVTTKPLLAMPNAGVARFAHGRFVYPHNPEYLGRYARKLVEAGCACIGGCCGTTPEHVRQIRSNTEGMRPAGRKLVRVEAAGRDEEERARQEVETTLRQMLGRKLVISVEVDPPRGPGAEKALAGLRRLKGLGVDAVNVSDSPMARLRMSPVAIAELIRRSLNLEVILHVTCRDKNLLAIQSDLLGYSAMDLHNVLALSGDPPSLGDYPFATAVYDVRSSGLIRIIDSLNRGRDILGNRLNASTGFFIGGGCPSSPADQDREIETVADKISHGVAFVQTQPVFDAESFERFHERLRGLGVPVVASLMPLTSMSSLEYFRHEVPGIEIPDTMLQRMAEATSLEPGLEPERAEEKVGIRLARELLERLRAIGVSGVCIIPPRRRYEIVEEMLDM
ncbi:bifunctional homocysteine S-methyltransferase/methylenetetrahydrofolate reductase [Candidatus Fermentibacterales bacterium]|nr:bifunctional homocysteine S-methyltransferase/methylenetetrahydrofolate reductase [Candidatus Fermentibacterales bacterium]